jgi:photosystem II stability/assembly factor-like uncharacterized protein
MTDSLDRFLQDLRFDVPAGLVDRAMAAVAADAAGAGQAVRARVHDRGNFDTQRQTWAPALVALLLAVAIVASLLFIAHARLEVPAKQVPHGPAGLPSIFVGESLFVSPTTGWVSEWRPAMLGPSVIFRTTDGGQHWQKQLSWDGPNGALQMRFQGSDGLVVGMGQDASDPTSTLIFSTTDGGSHWQRVSLPIGAATSAGEPPPLIYFRDPLEGWLVSYLQGGSPVAAVFHTTDSGQHWTQTAQFAVNQNMFAGLSGGGRIQFRDASNGSWTGTSSGVEPSFLNTRDGGKTWTQVKLSPPAMRPNEVAAPLDLPHYFNDADGVLVVSTTSTVGGPGSCPCVPGQPSPSPEPPPSYYLYTTGDGGAHWSAPMALPVIGRSPGFFFLDSAHSWMVSDQTVAISADLGQHWTIYRGALPPQVSLISFPGNAQFLTPTDGWAAATTQPANQSSPVQSLVSTADGGLHWAAMNMPAPDQVK